MPETLDHLIHLVPSLESSIQLYSSLGFQVQRGGQHADGLTENALIVLPDGVYIELIAFIEGGPDPSAHWWYGRQNGWIDWCLLDRPSPSQVYKEGQRGGRKTLSGEEIKWEVTFPTEQYARGTVPFYCADLTPRESRVPARDVHHNAVQGVSALRVLFKSENVERMKGIYEGVLGAGKEDGGGYVFELRTPSGGNVAVTLKAAQDPQEVQWIHDVGEGLFEVEVCVPPDHLPSTAPPDGIERTTWEAGYGRLRFHPVVSGE